MTSWLGGTNRLVPMILAVGNHDVGIDSLDEVKITPSEWGPFWFAYNPQHFDTASRTVPPISLRKTYFSHKLGSTTLISLDSGFRETFEHQAQYLQSTLSNLSGHIPISIYHIALYPACVHGNGGKTLQAYQDAKKYF